MKSKLFWAILILALVLRFYKLGENPPSLDWDENSNAYNAYSILKTGRDEYGTFLPITNRSFDDYKPPAYMYLNIPTVAIFGLTPFAARLPSAIFGFLTVPLIYFLTKKLFEDEGRLAAIKKRSANLDIEIASFNPPRSSLRHYQISEENNQRLKSWLCHVFDWRQASRKPATSYQLPETIALLAMFLLAVSPWHLQFSRVGFEATVGLFAVTVAITAFLYGLSDKKWLIISAIALGLSSYTYHTQRIFVPLLFLATFFIFKDQILSVSKKYLASFLIITILIGLPLVILIPPKVILQRFEVTTGRPKLEDIEKSIKFILQDREVGSPLGHIIHNRRFVIGQTYFGNYLSHFDFNFLFTKGDDNFRHHIQDMGMLYLFELPLVIFGIYRLLRYRTKFSAFLLAWLLLAPIAATPATPNPHANRSFPMIVAFEIIAAYGFISLASLKFFAKRVVFCAFSIWIAVSVLTYLETYWVHYPIEKASFWQYGYSQAAQESEKIKDQYEKINIDKTIEQAYAFWLFNTGYDPASYQQQGTRYHFDKYIFEAKPPTDSNQLFISDVGKFPGDFEVIKTIYYPDGTEAVKIGHPR